MDIVEHNPANNRRHPWELARLEVMWHFIRKYRPSADKLLILDIGCGDCFFSMGLLQKQLPATIIGIDPAYTQEEIVRKMKEISHPDFYLFRTLEEAQILLNSPVDFLLLLDVIEHIPDDMSFLKDLAGKNFIHTKTRFLITVPSYQSLFTSHDKFLLHFRRYTNTSLKKAISSSHLQPEETGYFFFSLLPWRALQKLKEKIFGRPEKNYGLGAWTHGPFLTGLVKHWLLIDFAITRFFKRIGITMPGLSNYSICRKPVS